MIIHVFALANGRVSGVGVKSTGATLGVRSRDISEAKNSGYAVPTLTFILPLFSSSSLTSSLNRNTSSTNSTDMSYSISAAIYGILVYIII